MPRTFDQPQSDGGGALLARRAEAPERNAIEAEVDVVAMWAMMRHSALGVAIPARDECRRDRVAHLVLCRVRRQRFSRPVAQFRRSAFAKGLRVRTSTRPRPLEELSPRDRE